VLANQRAAGTVTLVGVAVVIAATLVVVVAQLFASSLREGNVSSVPPPTPQRNGVPLPEATLTMPMTVRRERLAGLVRLICQSSMQRLGILVTLTENKKNED
jgi:hypothetical protein